MVTKVSEEWQLGAKFSNTGEAKAQKQVMVAARVGVFRPCALNPNPVSCHNFFFFQIPLRLFRQVILIGTFWPHFATKKG